MQYFLGYTSFTDEAPFDASLFVDFRKRLGKENVNAISERIVALKTRFKTKNAGVDKPILMGYLFWMNLAGMRLMKESHDGIFGTVPETVWVLPEEVLAGQIYCTRVNRAALKEKGVKLLAKPLGRPSALQIQVSPGERNPSEGKFGQAKTGYGLNHIRARLNGTSETWIASIFLVLNLVKLAGAALPCLYMRFVGGFSASNMLLGKVNQILLDFFSMGVFLPQIQNPYQVEMKMVA